MPPVRNAIRPLSFEPDTLRVLGEIFDLIWASVATDFGDHPDEIEVARIRLTPTPIDVQLSPGTPPFPWPPGLCVAEPSLLKVVSFLPNMPDAQLLHMPTMFGHPPPFSASGRGAALFGEEGFAAGGDFGWSPDSD